MKVIIKHLKFEFKFGRSVAMAQLYQVDDAGDATSRVMDGRLADIVTHINDSRLTLVNAQEVLDNMVRLYGFGA